MTDYREFLGVLELAQETNDGEGVKIAVIDTGVPSIEDIFTCLSDNFTSEGPKDSGHATFIGSLLFGRGPVTGICRNATACFIKVFAHGSTRPSTVAKAILRAVKDWKVDLINLSLGFSRSTPYPEELKKACEQAYASGVILVAAAGNDGGAVLWPAALPTTICVGSFVGKGKEVFSNQGEVDFVLPGRDLEGQEADGRVTKKSGTSFSTALVSGLLGLMIARRKKNNLSITVQDVKHELRSWCQDLGSPGWDPDTGYGCPVYSTSRRMSMRSRVRLLSSRIFGTIRALLDKAILGITRRKING